MDVVLARTFLAIVETGSFLGAANRVHVTQSTVSMRMKSLEDQLGKQLFERSKAGAALTPAGQQFERHALTIVRAWEQARLEVALPPGYQAALTVGGQYSLWDGYLIDWLAQMRRSAADIAIRTQLGFSNQLMQRLIEGTLDLAVMYTPQSRPGFEIELLFEEELVLVTSEPRPPKRPGKNYIYVDWGPEFQADHSLNFADLETPGLYMEIGSLGLKYLMATHASGYFPRRVVEPYLAAGQLVLVETAPIFSYPAYVVYPTDMDKNVIRLVLRNFRNIAAEQAVTVRNT